MVAIFLLFILSPAHDGAVSYFYLYASFCALTMKRLYFLREGVFIRRIAYYCLGNNRLQMLTPLYHKNRASEIFQFQRPYRICKPSTLPFNFSSFCSEQRFKSRNGDSLLRIAFFEKYSLTGPYPLPTFQS